MSKKKVAVDGANIYCPNTMPGIPNLLKSTTDVEATGCSFNSILTEDDDQFQVNIFYFGGCQLTKNKKCSMLPKTSPGDTTFWRDTGKALTDGSADVLIKGSYFTCLQGGQESDVKIIDAGQSCFTTTPSCETFICPEDSWGKTAKATAIGGGIGAAGGAATGGGAVVLGGLGALGGFLGTTKIRD